MSFEPVRVKPGTREIGYTADDGSQVTLKATTTAEGTFVTPRSGGDVIVLEAYRSDAVAPSKPARKRSSSSKAAKAKATTTEPVTPAETTGPATPAPTTSEG